MIHANYFLLDVFTDNKFGGNQLALFPDARFIKDELLQKLAKELNLSETVFLYPPAKGENWRMRIFTPGRELNTAGHPTVGTAYYLSRETLHPENNMQTISLEQKIGTIKVDIEYENNVPMKVTMHQPLPEFGQTHNDKVDIIAKMLSISPTEIDDLPIQEVSCGNNTLLIPVKNLETLSKIKFRLDVWEDFTSVINDAFIYPFSTNGVIQGGVQGRMFAPEVGIIEDPATGSANGPLASYLSKYQIAKMPLVSLQGYEMGRPSQLHLDIDKDSEGNITSVKVGGNCAFVGKGLIYLDFE